MLVRRGKPGNRATHASFIVVSCLVILGVAFDIIVHVHIHVHPHVNM